MGWLTVALAALALVALLVTLENYRNRASIWPAILLLCIVVLCLVLFGPPAAIDLGGRLPSR